jgi:hypothetical protein
MSPKVAHAKAHLANAFIRGVTLMVAYARLKTQNQIKDELSLLTDEETIDV